MRWRWYQPWQQWLVAFFLVSMMAVFVFVFLVSNGAVK